MSKPAKIGPWGGNGGTAQDININQKPIRLVSVTINSGEDVINAISFEYVGSDCRVYSAGPWGGIGVKQEKTESPKTYGKPRGTPFRIPVLDGGRIVGFFGRSGAYLNAIGLYVKPSA